MKKRNHLIMGSAFTLATLAIAIDHSKHPLPEPVQQQSKSGTTLDLSSPGTNPCSVNPCSVNPCSVNPCSVNPCGLK